MEDRSRMTDMILDLTLEILCLLTGERCVVVKMASIEGLLQGLYPPLSGEQNPLSAPPHDRSNEKKILEVINQVIELLTGESHGNMIVKETMEAMKVGVLEESVVMEDQPTNRSRKRDHPERSPRFPYFWDSAQEDKETPPFDQEGELIGIKVEVHDEEASVIGDSQPMGNLEMWETTKVEDISQVDNPEHNFRNILDGSPALSRGWRKENDDIVRNFHPRRHSATVSPDPINPEGSSLAPAANRMGCIGHQVSVCPDCGRSFTSKITYKNHRRIHSENRPYSCAECGKSFKQKTHLATHQTSHARAQPFSCFACGKLFTTKTKLVVHERHHTGGKIHACPECGKEFAVRSKLERHRIRHTGDKPLSCPQCDYRTAFRSALVTHLRTHTGERPFVCPVCGQDFRQKFLLYRHQRSKKH